MGTPGLMERSATRTETRTMIQADTPMPGEDPGVATLRTMRICLGPPPFEG